MSSILPKGRLAPSRINPKILLLYGLPKVGKTTLLSLLESCLILDTEKGAETLEVARLAVTSISGPTVLTDKGEVAFTSANAVYDEIMKIGIEEFQRTNRKPKPPYKFLAIDTLDKFEDYCETEATKKFKETPIGRGMYEKGHFETSVLQIPQGGGYYYLRNEVLEQIDRFAGICEYLILVSHVKEKNLNKAGVEVTVRDISLTGKLGSMVAAKADAIAYLYREMNNPQLMVSFETYEGSVMGARIPRLAGRKFPFDWKEIYAEDGVPAPLAETPKEAAPAV